MSFDAAIGRIDQIVALSSSLLGPDSVTSSPAVATSETTSPTTAGGTSGPSDFSAALASAQASLTAGATGPGGAAVPSLDGSTASLAGDVTAGLLPDPANLSLMGAAAPANSLTGGTGASSPQVQAMVQEADSLIGKPYVWGGGHDGWGPQSGYDCSGFVSAVLHAGGYLTTPQDTETLPSAPGIEPGPGQHVTIYDRTTPGTEGHVIIDIDGQFYESGGEQGAWGGGGGVEKISTPTPEYLATFNTILHPAGL